MQVMQNHPKVLKNPAPTVIVRGLTDSAIQLSIRPWAKNIDFGEMNSDILEQCKTAFDQANIVIQPYARDVTKD